MITALLPLASFFSAAAALAVEIAVVRLGAPHVGQSLLPWSAAIVAVLCGLALGHLLGGQVGGEQARQARLRATLAAAWAAAGLGALLMPVLAPTVAAALAGPEGPGAAAVAGLSALALPPSIAAGFVLPVLLRCAVAEQDYGAPQRVAAILAGSAAGSVAGTAAAGFLLLETLGAAGLTRGVGLLWLLLAATVVPWQGLLARAAALSVAGFAVVLFLTPLPITCQEETRYTCIRLHDQSLPSGKLLRFMVLDEGVHSASDRDDPARLHLGYAALTDRLARPVLEASGAPRALVIGGGGATLPRAWAATLPNAHITVAELDARVASTAAASMWASGPQMQTLVGDGRAALRGLSAGTSYDVVLMDAYRTQSVPPHLVTREYAALVTARLAPGGVYLSNVIDRTQTMQLSLAVATTLALVFPRVELWVPEVTADGMTNVVVAAWRAPARPGPEALEVRATVWDAGGAARNEAVRWHRLSPAEAQERWPAACPLVLTDDHAPVDRLLAGLHTCRRTADRRAHRN